MRETVNEFGVQGTYSGSYIRAKRADELRKAAKVSQHSSERLLWLAAGMLPFFIGCGLLLAMGML